MPRHNSSVAAFEFFDGFFAAVKAQPSLAVACVGAMALKAAIGKDRTYVAGKVGRLGGWGIGSDCRWNSSRKQGESNNSSPVSPSVPVSASGEKAWPCVRHSQHDPNPILPYRASPLSSSLCCAMLREPNYTQRPITQIFKKPVGIAKGRWRFVRHKPATTFSPYDFAFSRRLV